MHSFFVQKSLVLDGRMDGWVDGSKRLRIAYSNQYREREIKEKRNQGKCLGTVQRDLNREKKE